MRTFAAGEQWQGRAAQAIKDPKEQPQRREAELLLVEAFPQNSAAVLQKLLFHSPDKFTGESQTQLRDTNPELEVISSNFHLNDCHRDELRQLSHEPAFREMAPRI